jgi:hypothetical protein
MDSLKEALALGFELTSFIIVSYIVHEPVAEYFLWEKDITLAGLLSLSLTLWITHAIIYSKKKA